MTEPGIKPLEVSCALARWLSGLQSHPTQQKVVGSVPGQGPYLQVRSPVRGVEEAND